MTFKQCSNCAYVIAYSDESVGMFNVIEECRCPYTKDVILTKSLDQERECPFYIPQYETERELTRCQECNAPRHRADHYNPHNETIELTCLNCGNRQRIEVYDLYF